jgi:hypothetical protein
MFSSYRWSPEDGAVQLILISKDFDKSPKLFFSMLSKFYMN